MKRFLTYFLQGLILFIPFAITVAIIFKLFDFFEGIFSVIGITDYSALNTLLGLVFTLAFILGMGILASTFIFKSFFLKNGHIRPQVAGVTAAACQREKTSQRYGIRTSSAGLARAPGLEPTGTGRYGGCYQEDGLPHRDGPDLAHP